MNDLIYCAAYMHLSPHAIYKQSIIFSSPGGIFHFPHSRINPNETRAEEHLSYRMCPSCTHKGTKSSSRHCKYNRHPQYPCNNRRNLSVALRCANSNPSIIHFLSKKEEEKEARKMYDRAVKTRYEENKNKSLTPCHA